MTDASVVQLPSKPILELPATLPNRPTRILLICHAESLQRRYGNLTLTDTGLTALGWEQSSALAEWLRTHEQIDNLITSPQLRCRLTAQRVSQSLGIPVVLESLFPMTPRRDWLTQPPIFHTPTEQDADAAEYAGYLHRVIEAFNHTLGTRWGTTTAVIANPNAIVALLRILGGGQLAVNLDDTGITEFTLVDRRWLLAYVNRREHLPRPMMNNAVARAEMPIDSDVRDQVVMARQVYNQIATSVSIEELQEQANITGANDKDFVRFAEISEGQRILEVGSGLGHLSMSLAKTGALEVVGIDVSPAMLERAEYLRLSSGDADILRRVSYRLGPAHDLPFANQTFDLVVCRMLLHHIVKLRRALDEFNRVLKPGGLLLIDELNGSDDAVKRATQNAIESRRNPSHATIRTPAQYRDQLNTAGFQVQREKIAKRERRVKQWLDEVAVDGQTRHAVTEMLEASIETDAAELNVHEQNDELIFDQQIIYIVAQKTE
ncbi:methyltransferase domain-containing protein [bacterium]|nr:methyltransferase domain-containing protein [bacterium]